MQEFQLFIKNNSSDVEKSLGNLGKTNNREISAKYSQIFQDILSNESTSKEEEGNGQRVM